MTHPTHLQAWKKQLKPHCPPRTAGCGLGPPPTKPHSPLPPPSFTTEATVGADRPGQWQSLLKVITIFTSSSLEDTTPGALRTFCRDPGHARVCVTAHRGPPLPPGPAAAQRQTGQIGRDGKTHSSKEPAPPPPSLVPKLPRRSGKPLVILVFFSPLAFPSLPGSLGPQSRQF